VIAEEGLLAPALGADHREQEIAGQQTVGLDERLQVLAGLERGTVSTYGAPRSEAGPSGRKASFTAGRATFTRSGSIPSVPTTSRPVYSEFT